MKKYIIGISLLALVVSVNSTSAETGTVSTAQVDIQNIDSKLKELDSQTEELEDVKKQIEQKLSAVQNSKEQKQLLLASLNREIITQQDLYTQYSETFEKLQIQIYRDLDSIQKTKESIRLRDKSNGERLRFMYMNGGAEFWSSLLSVSGLLNYLSNIEYYNELLRFDDTSFLKNKADLSAVQEKERLSIELLQKAKEQLDKAQSLYASMGFNKQFVEELVNDLQQQQATIEHISEEQDRKIKELIQIRSELYRIKENLSMTSAASFNSGEFVWPTEARGVISSRFGDLEERGAPHKGLDIANPAGTAVLSSIDGRVLVSSWVNGYGNCIVIEDQNGLTTLYGHMLNDSLEVKPGDVVKAGQKIAKVGSTGNSTGNHLHFEVLVGGVNKDPEPYLTGQAKIVAPNQVNPVEIPQREDGVSVAAPPKKR